MISTRTKRITRLVNVAARVTAIALLATSCSESTSTPESTPSATSPSNAPTATLPSPPATNNVSESVLIGQWVRPDGGYVIELRNPQAGGKLEAFYFNPRPINVSRAEWRRENDGLHVFVELRDQNYPGATYKLRYLRDKDVLSGEYFQPLHQQTFEVFFTRRQP